jgi:hypothetical protein
MITVEIKLNDYEYVKDADLSEVYQLNPIYYIDVVILLQYTHKVFEVIWRGGDYRFCCINRFSSHSTTPSGRNTLTLSYIKGII